MPVSSTFAVFEPRREKGLGREKTVWIFADPDAFEEGLCKEVVTAVADGKGVVKISKSGGTVVGAEQMKIMVELAAKRWDVVVNEIEEAGST